MNVPRPALIAGIIGTLAFGAVGGAVFDGLTVPLAWLIGAMVIIMIMLMIIHVVVIMVMIMVIIMIMLMLRHVVIFPT